MQQNSTLCSQDLFNIKIQFVITFESALNKTFLNKIQLINNCFHIQYYIHEHAKVFTKSIFYQTF